MEQKVIYNGQILTLTRFGQQESLACGSPTHSRSECLKWNLWEATRTNTAFS